MDRQIKGLLYFFVADSKRSFMIFWAILVASLVGTIVITYVLLDVGEVNMNFSLTFAMAIYCSIFGFITVKESIPFSIKMGATRKNYFISLGIFFMGLAFVKALLANIIQEVVLLLTNQLSFDTFGFLYLALLVDDTWINRVIIDSITMFFFLTVMYGVGLLFYKYGLAGGGIFISVLFAGLLIVFTGGYLTDFVIEIVENLSLVFFYQLAGITIFLYGITWLLIRNITVGIKK
ncbi:hypothetical protein VBD025_00130 [Virgibacillus flavescens]|uniref:hypothetical protein n=1 Tax=Virgibacillus flavescens TaxID=1611422 RepID=UPI003D326D42